MKKKSAWDPRDSREKRMRAAWIDAMRIGQTKLPFAEFEKRMLMNDIHRRKQEFFERRIRVDWDAIERYLASQDANNMAEMANN